MVQVIVFKTRNTFIGVRVGEAGRVPPVSVLKFFGQNADDSGKSAREKIF